VQDAERQIPLGAHDSCAFPGDELCPDTGITVPGPLFPKW